MRHLWERIKADIHRAPLWVWLGLAGTAVLIYLAWRNGGLSGLSSPSLPTVPTVDTTGGGTPDSSATTTLPVPTSPAFWTSGGGGGDGGSGAAATGGSIGPVADRPVDPAGTGGGDGNPYGQGYGTPINNPTALQQREHRGTTAARRPTGGSGSGPDGSDLQLAQAERRYFRRGRGGGGAAAPRPSGGAAAPHAPAHLSAVDHAPHPTLRFRHSAR